VQGLRAEVEQLRLRLEEAEQALEAIRTGQVDSLIIEGAEGPQVFSLVSAAEIQRDATALHAIVIPEDRARLMEAEERSREAVSRLDIELRLRHRTTAELRWVWMRSIPHRRPDGRTEWDGLYFDITGRKRCQGEVRDGG
jgi:PAS domain-containing protein